jgi:hypothetical protein
LRSLWIIVTDVGAVVDDDVRPMVDRGPDVTVVGLVVLALDCVDRNPLLDQGGSHVVLGRERVARAEHGIRAAGLEGEG